MLLQKGGGILDAHSKLLHELLDIGQTLLISGAEINRVEDTLIRLGSAYGAARVDIFVITSDIILTMQFPDGDELTQSRRISQTPSTDFTRLEQLNALSRACCAQPLPLDELHARVQQIAAAQTRVPVLYTASAMGAGCFTVFFGGGLWDALAAGALGLLVCLLQRRALPVFRNAAVFQFLTALLVGTIGCLSGRICPFFAVDKILIGVIMLLIPGVATTNAARDMLIGHTISGLLRLAESLLLAGALALGFGSAIYLFGV